MLDGIVSADVLCISYAADADKSGKSYVVLVKCRNHIYVALHFSRELNALRMLGEEFTMHV